MSSEETWGLTFAFGIAAVLMWAIYAWDGRRIDQAIRRKYPKPVTQPEPRHRLTWEEKRDKLELRLEREHKTTDEEDFIPYGAFFATPLGFHSWWGWLGAIIGIPVGMLLFLAIKAWMERDRRRAAKDLASHLRRHRGDAFFD